MVFSLSNTDFGQLRAFVAVAEALNYTRAAAGLGITNSALSRTVRLLEESVGVRLISRTTRRVALTTAGDQLLQRVRPAIAELESAMGQARRYSERSVDVVRIHTVAVGAELLVRPILRSFSDTYPEVVLDVTLGDEPIDMAAADYDLSIRAAEGGERGMVTIRLGGEFRQIAVAAPDYIARYGTPGSPHDLLAHRCLAWRLPGQDRPARWEFCENGRWFNIVVDGPMIANSRELAVQAAIDGLGIAYAIEKSVSGHLNEGRLVRILEPWSTPVSGFYLCYPVDRPMTPTLRVLIDAICSSGASSTKAKI